MTNVARHTETVVLGSTPRPQHLRHGHETLSTRKPSPLIPCGRPDDGSQPTKDSVNHGSESPWNPSPRVAVLLTCGNQD